MKKFLAVLLVFGLLITLLAGCGGSEAEPPESGDHDISNDAEESSPLKVGMLLPGTINDMGWNAAAYNGLLFIEEVYGAEIAFTEHTLISEQDEVYRLYAENGFDIIIAHGNEYADGAERLHEEFPDVQFCVTASDIEIEPNVSSINIDNAEQGFMAGVVAAVVTETNIVGGIGGMFIPAIEDFIIGFEVGAKYINPDIEVLTAYTGDFIDAVKAGETAQAMIDQGADILTHNASPAGTSVLTVSEDEGIIAIGATADQYELAPGAVLTSSITDMPKAILTYTEATMKDDFKASMMSFGVTEGVVYLAPYYQFEEMLTEEQINTINQILEDLGSGVLDIREMADFNM